MNEIQLMTAGLFIIPLLNSVLGLVFSSKSIIRISAIVSSLLTFSLVIFIFPNAGLSVVRWSWFSLGTNPVDIVFDFNSITIPLAIGVSFISLLVNLYSLSFFHWDVHQPRYFATLSLFTFSMMGLTLSGNLLQTFVFWELVGMTSYLLIGFYRSKPEAAAASTKAFIMNKIGDAGFIIALITIYSNSGSLEISGLETLSVPATHSLIIGIGLTLAILSKSAQFPFHTWLPDAMEGPTPVSALIHSATMVAAGVFLLIRLPFLFTIELLQLISIIGMVTAVAGGINALREEDLKKILAWSTVSQLGLMIMVAGLGGFTSSYVHLLSHAIFKAGLFLAGGILISNSISSNISDVAISGKSVPLKLTIALLIFSLMGLPFTVGFLSKEYLMTAISSNFYLVIYFSINAISILYSARMLSVVYPFNKQTTTRIEPMFMMAPVIILSIFSLWIAYSPSPIEMGWIAKAWKLNPPSLLLTILSATWALIWLALTLYLVRREKLNYFLSWIPIIKTDQFLQSSLVKPIMLASEITIRIDNKIIDKGLHGFVYVNFSIALLARWVDKNLIDGIVRLCSWLIRVVGSFLRRFVAGKIQDYIWWTVVTLAILFILSRN